VILALDTTGFKCGTAVWDESIVSVIETEEKLRHNEIVLNQIQKLLNDNKKALTDLTAVAVSSGPGSFTGLRVGMSVAKSLCWSLELPLIAIPTLEGLANTVPEGIDSVVAIMPARSDEVYWSHFVKQNNHWEDRTQERLNKLTEIRDYLTEEAYFTGEGFERHSEVLNRIFGNQIINSRVSRQPEPLVKATAMLGSKRFIANQFDDLMESEPRYCYQFPRRQP